MKLAIADPPYPPHRAVRRDRPGGNERLVVRSRARRWYGDGTRAMNDRVADHHERAGEWDAAATHWQLVEDLLDEYDGWAIATSMDGLDRKPEAWTRWVLDALGYDQGVDRVDDLFPGSGAVSTAMAQGVLL